MRRSIHVAALAGVLAVLLATLGAGAALAITPVTTITSAGPLENIYLGDELGCQVDHTADEDFQFFHPNFTPGDCGTLVEVGGTLYTPDFSNHGAPPPGATATGGLGARTVFTLVSQSGVMGTGTDADPFRVVTTVGLGQTGLQIEETDSYVVGDEAYRTDVKITNDGSSGQTGVLYRAADCFLGGTDVGFGFTETFGNRKAVGCSQNANNTPPGRILEWVPLTGGNNFYQADFNQVWQAIGAGTPFPDIVNARSTRTTGRASAGASRFFQTAVRPPSRTSRRSPPRGWRRSRRRRPPTARPRSPVRRTATRSRSRTRTRSRSRWTRSRTRSRRGSATSRTRPRARRRTTRASWGRRSRGPGRRRSWSRRTERSSSISTSSSPTRPAST